MSAKSITLFWTPGTVCLSHVIRPLVFSHKPFTTRSACLSITPPSNFPLDKKVLTKRMKTKLTESVKMQQNPFPYCSAAELLNC